MNFIQLIKKHPVEIPLLQRDYAQGRDDTRADQIRGKFLEDLHKAISAPDDKPCLVHLDFIYGEIRADGVFEPIDGQQRLTTLFLLHWYLAAVDGQDHGFRELLYQDDPDRPRFRYAMRPITERFFVRLLQHPELTKNGSVSGTWLSTRIQDQAWFIGDWRHDPTVAGALVMLDAIAEKFSSDSTACANAYAKLTGDSCPIIFDLLTLDSIGQGDDIYVKMNARGKPLNDFEKFKAWLIRRCENENLIEKKEITDLCRNLDNDWLEFFWHHVPADENADRADHVSRVFFRTVLALAVNHHAQYDSNDETVEKWLNAPLHEQRDTWLLLFTPTSIRYVIGQLNNLAELLCDKETKAWRFTPPPRFGGVNDQSNNYPTAFLECDSDKLELRMRLWLRVLDVFATYHKDSAKLGLPEAQKWLRGIRNLLEYTPATAKNFSSIIRGLGKLPGKMIDAPEAIPGLDPGQLKEEVRKAGLRNADTAWETPLADAEDHDLLRGQIEFLLGSETPIIGDFEKRWAVFANWFPSVIRKDPEEIDLICAALARSVSIKLDGGNRLELPHNPELWRDRLARTSHAAHQKFREGCFRLLSEAAQSGNQTIPKESTALPGAEPWMRDFIQHGRQLWRQDWEGKVQNYNGNGVFLFHRTNRNDGDILLGPVAAMRNELIRKLTNAATPIRFALSESSWSPVEGATEALLFYKGHKITLYRKDANNPSSVVECAFGYHKLTLRLSKTENSPTLDVDYPEGACLATFAADLTNAAKARNDALPGDPLTVALADIARLANELVHAQLDATSAAPATA